MRYDAAFDYYFGEFDVPSCQATDIIKINTAGFPQPVFFGDIAISPSGEVYCFISAFTSTFIVKLDVQNNTMSIVTNTPTNYNSMVCGADNILYLASGFGFYTYDLNTNIGTDLGPVNFQPSGDLTFINNQLYCTAIPNSLIQVNLADPNQSTVLFNYSLPNTYSAWGVVSIVESCDSTTTYITVTSGDQQVTQIYLLDVQNQSVSLLCNSPGPIVGAASTNEFIASDCAVRLDLDPDSLTSDWSPTFLCETDTIPICDSMATYYSGYLTDSITLSISLPIDTPIEFLTATPNASVNVLGQGSTKLTLIPASGSSISNNPDFQNVLRSVRWHDHAVPATPGAHTIEIIAYASSNHTDTAYSFISVAPIPIAGRDTVVNICIDAPSFDLSDMLDANATPGGIWSSNTPQDLTFSPQNNTPGTFYYVVDSGFCPPDSASIGVEVSPLPFFSLGQDTSVCSGYLLSLTTPYLAIWQDGKNAFEYEVTQSGSYWAEVIDSIGCQFRDTIDIVIKPEIHTQSIESLCSGQNYSWNGETFNKDTVVCAVFAGTNDCDSTHCLTLTFLPTSISLDTSICSGNSIFWYGNNYNSSGIYTDTLMVNGCLTAATLSLFIAPADTSEISAEICNGDSYQIGNQSFNTSGQYFIQLSSSAGCDSIIQLDLSVNQPEFISTSIDVCAGTIYNWEGQELAAPGTYEKSYNCDSIVTLQLTWSSPPQPEISGDTIICPGDLTLLSVANYSQYQWSTGQVTTDIDVSAGNYFVTVTDANGCIGSDSILILESDPIQADWDQLSPVCHNGTDGLIELNNISGGNPPFSFQLNGNPKTNTPYFPNLASGSWNIDIIDNIGCKSIFQLYLDNPPDLIVNLGTDPPPFESNQTFPLIPQINIPGTYSYSWIPQTGLSCYNCSEPIATLTEEITYIVLVTDEYNCISKDSITLKVKKNEGIYVPQIFSPNGDGLNDVFNVFTDLGIINTIDLFRVYDRWGELLFERRAIRPNEEESGWDGTIRGKKALPGVYVWYLETRQNDGTLLQKSGEITLIR